MPAGANAGPYNGRLVAPEGRGLQITPRRPPEDPSLGHKLADAVWNAVARKASDFALPQHLEGQGIRT